jgi:hypothetical protein
LSLQPFLKSNSHINLLSPGSPAFVTYGRLYFSGRNSEIFIKPLNGDIINTEKYTKQMYSSVNYKVNARVVAAQGKD